MNYTYKCIPFDPSAVAVIRTKEIMNKTADSYEDIIAAETRNGWELDLIDTITQVIPAGCAFFGGKDTVVTFKMLVFKRKVE